MASPEPTSGVVQWPRLFVIAQQIHPQAEVWFQIREKKPGGMVAVISKDELNHLLLHELSIVLHRVFSLQFFLSV